ncbi:12828_t:CDS:2, partial [Gigaspora rosea]
MFWVELGSYKSIRIFIFEVVEVGLFSSSAANSISIFCGIAWYWASPSVFLGHLEYKNSKVCSASLNLFFLQLSPVGYQFPKRNCQMPLSNEEGSDFAKKKSFFQNTRNNSSIETCTDYIFVDENYRHCISE